MRWGLCTAFGFIAISRLSLAWEVSFYNDFCPGQNQGEGNKGNNLFHMTGGPSDSKWCFKVRGSKSAFTISTQGVVDDDVEITLYSDEKCDKPFAENITFDGCIAGPREHIIKSVRVLPAEEKEYQVTEDDKPDGGKEGYGYLSGEPSDAKWGE